MAKIAIDARFLGPEGTGLGKYTEKLLEHLEQIDTKNEYFVILRNANFPLFNPKGKNFHKVKADVRWYTAKEQFVIPWVLRNLAIDLLHVPHFNVPVVWNKKLVVTIHDLIKSNFKGKGATTLPAPLYTLKNKGYELVLKSAVRKADKICTPSEFSKKSLVSFGVPEDKIVVTYEAAEDHLSQVPAVSEVVANSILERYGIRKPYLLYVGNAYPYKNVSLILKALKALPSEINFVCVSARNSFYERLLAEAEEQGVKSRLFVTGYVSNEELRVLYDQSTTYVFPSLSEGFGIPGLDAMNLGIPLISSNASCLPEVYKDGALFFDPTNPNDLADKVLQVYSDTHFRDDLLKKGQKVAKSYSWHRMAEQTLAVYTSVLSSNP